VLQLTANAASASHSMPYRRKEIKVSKKIMSLLAILALLLASAPLALAQQQGSTTQPTAVPQYPASDQTQPPTNNSTQPAARGTQSTPSATSGLTSLNQNNQLVIDCPGVSNALAQSSSGLTQTDQSQLQRLERLCTDSGYAPADSGGGGTQPSTNGTSSTQGSQA
jgi:hypothetical protein